MEMANSGKLRDAGTGKFRQRQPTGADAEVGAAIKTFRLLRGMSQDMLAKKLGVTFQQIQKYEKGVNRIGAGRLPLIARILGVSIAELFQEHASVSDADGHGVPTKLVTDTATVRLLLAYGTIESRAV